MLLKKTLFKTSLHRPDFAVIVEVVGMLKIKGIRGYLVTVA